MKPRVLILSGYGINCERETKFAFDLVGGEAEVVHVNDLINKKRKLEDYEILVFPGGFSYGDDTGSGRAMANKIRLNLWDDLLKFIESKKLIIGICNGFQVLINLGLLPALEKYGEHEAELTFNDSTKYECRWINLKANSNKCVFTKNIDKLYLPVAHGEGKFFAKKEVLEKLKENDQIVFTYTLDNGILANGKFPENPNGSLQDIAGICDPSGRILGMMPHPERSILYGSSPYFQNLKELFKRRGEKLPKYYEPSLRIFKNAVNYAKEELEKNTSSFSYSDAGVDIELGDDASKILYNAAKQTWKNREGLIGEVIVPFDDFSGLRMIDIGNLPKNTMMCLGFDGVGTKIEIAERLNNYRTIAFDLLAMVCDDAVVRGGEPGIMGSILDVKSLGKDGSSHIEKIKQLAEGYILAAKEANVAIINGEIAELSNRVSGYGDFNSNWGGGLVWFANKDKMFTGYEIQAGDKIVALEEKGFRSNGLSLVRNIFSKIYGEEWHNIKLDNQSLGELVLIPSKIYSKAVVDMIGGIDKESKVEIHGVAHITGGGIPGKLRRILKTKNLGAELDNLFEPSKAMLHCQEIGEVNGREAYKTWNMGNGMLIITPNPEKVIEIAKQNGIEAKEAGEVTTDSKIKIKSKGAFAVQNSDLVFED